MSNVVSILSVAHAQATAEPATKPVFVGTVWILDESEEVIIKTANVLLEAARTMRHLKTARSTQNLPAMHKNARVYESQIEYAKRLIGQTFVMAQTLHQVTTKHMAHDPQGGIDAG